MKFIIEETDRKFTHVDGFSDNTDYVLVDDIKKLYFLVSKDGVVKPVDKGFSLEECLYFVRTLDWKEIK